MGKTGQERKELPRAQDLDRMRIKGDEETRSLFLTGPLDKFLKDFLMAAVNAVKNAEGRNGGWERPTKPVEAVECPHRGEGNS